MTCCCGHDDDEHMYRSCACTVAVGELSVDSAGEVRTAVIECPCRAFESAEGDDLPAASTPDVPTDRRTRMTEMTAGEALGIASSIAKYPPHTDDESIAGRQAKTVIALAAEVDRCRGVITEYVNEVESGEKFDALCLLVPGLVSDDGQYGAVDPNPGPPVIGRTRFADGGAS